jgi:hypothetical protein
MGPEIMDSCAAAVQRNHELLEPAVYFKAMTALSRAEPHTSYRTPLSLEAGMLSLFEVIYKHSSKLEKPEPKQEDARTLESFAFVSGEHAASDAAIPKAAPKRRVAARKKTSTAK